MKEKFIDGLSKFWSTLNRKKTVTEDFHDTQLRRCLSTFDLTLLGIGHMIGAGIYVMSGTIVKNIAGPAAVLSYVFAGIAAILSALCYAEFGALVPKAGSAYSYTYITLGEFWGFIVGWNIVLEHLLGASSVARAWSGTVDAMFNGVIRNTTISIMGNLHTDSEWLSDYLDFVAFSIIVLVLIIVAIGVRFSTYFNNIFTITNLVIITFLIGIGLYFSDTSNWTDPDKGGFFPMGFEGAWEGAAMCFFAYIGFEGVAVAGEEAKSPEKSIPIATIVSLSMVTLLYVLVTITLTLMVPYYDVDPTAAFPMAFSTVGAQWAKYVVAVGTLFALTTTLLGSAFTLPRCIYAMADDGLLFRVFAYVHPKTQTPIWGILVFGLLAAILAMLFEIETLVEFMSIGTLFVYTSVAASVVILRYLPVEKCQFTLILDNNTTQKENVKLMRTLKQHDDIGRLKNKLQHIPVLKSLSPGNAALTAIFVMLLAMICFCGVLIHGFDSLRDLQWWAILLCIIFGGLIVLCYLILVAHEKNDAFLTFQVSYHHLLYFRNFLFYIKKI